MITTYRPHVKRRFKLHGFLHRMRTHGGRNVIRRRRQAGRYQLTVR